MTHLNAQVHFQGAHIQTDTHSDIATYRLNQPRSRSSENIVDIAL